MHPMKISFDSLKEYHWHLHLVHQDTPHEMLLQNSIQPRAVNEFPDYIMGNYRLCKTIAKKFLRSVEECNNIRCKEEHCDTCWECRARDRCEEIKDGRAIHYMDKCKDARQRVKDKKALRRLVNNRRRRARTTSKLELKFNKLFI